MQIGLAVRACQRDDTLFGCCTQKRVPTAQANPLFLLQALEPSRRPGQDALCCVQESPGYLAGEQQGSQEMATEHTISKVHLRHSDAWRQGGQPPDPLHLLLPQHRPGQFCPCGDDLASRSCPTWGLVWALVVKKEYISGHLVGMTSPSCSIVPLQAMRKVWQKPGRPKACEQATTQVREAGSFCLLILQSFLFMALWQERENLLPMQ